MNIEKMLDYLKQVGLDIINKVGVLLDRAKGVVESVNIINEDGNMKEGIGKVSESTSILFDFLNFLRILYLVSRVVFLISLIFITILSNI